MSVYTVSSGASTVQIVYGEDVVDQENAGLVELPDVIGHREVIDHWMEENAQHQEVDDILRAVSPVFEIDRELFTAFYNLPDQSDDPIFDPDWMDQPFIYRDGEPDSSYMWVRAPAPSAQDLIDGPDSTSWILLVTMLKINPIRTELVGACRGSSI